MAIDVQKFTRNKSSKMTDAEATKAVSKYMTKIILEQQKWIAIEVNEILKNFKGYSSNVPVSQTKETNKVVNFRNENFNYKVLDTTQDFIIRPFVRKEVA